jgi:hypothetical protein
MRNQTPSLLGFDLHTECGKLQRDEATAAVGYSAPSPKSSGMAAATFSAGSAPEEVPKTDRMSGDRDSTRARP